MNESGIVTVDAGVAGTTLRFVRSPHPEFWRKFTAGNWEPQTVALLRRLLRPGLVYVDIGAWIGPTVLVAAACGARVVAFEPDPAARDWLQRNVALNPDLPGSVEIIPAALGDLDGVAELSSDELGNSMSSLARRAPASIEVQTIDAASWTATSAFLDAAVLKIDIEGGEYRLLRRLAPALRHHRPALLLSVHGYVIRESLRNLPRWLARPARRIRSGFARFRLLLALRPYSFLWIFDDSQGVWLPLRGRVLIRFTASLGDVELVAADGCGAVGEAPL